MFLAFCVATLASYGAQPDSLRILGLERRSNLEMVLRWEGAKGPFRVLSRTSLSDDWIPMGPPISGFTAVVNVAPGVNSFFVVTTDTTPPDTPARLRVSVNGSFDQLKVEWDPASDGRDGSGVRGYQLFRDNVLVRSVRAPATSVIETGLQDDTVYLYRVASVDQVGNQSPISVAVAGRTPKRPDGIAPSVPTALRAIAMDCGRIDLFWTASTDSGGSGIKGYEVYRDGLFLKLVLAPAVSTTDSGLMPSASYTYVLRAVDYAQNRSTSSAPASAATPACPCEYVLSPGNATYDAGGGAGTIQVSSGPRCSWSAESTANWVRVVSGGSGVGNGTVGFSVDPNTASTARSAVLRVEGHVFPISQEAAASPGVLEPWVERFGSSGVEIGRAVALDGHGGILVAGGFRGTMTVGPSSLTSEEGSTDIFIANYSMNGKPLWAKRYGGSGTEVVRRIARDESGNIYIVGHFSGTADFGSSSFSSAGVNDVFLVKLSGDGVLLWAKTIGGWDDDVAVGLAVDPEGNAIISGYFKGGVDFGGGILYSTYSGMDTFLAKYSPSGEHLWSQKFWNNADDQGAGVAVDSRGNIVLTGKFTGSIDLGGGEFKAVGSSDCYLAKFSAGGGHLWSKAFGGPNNDGLAGVALDALGNPYVLGYFNLEMDFSTGQRLTGAPGSDVFLAKFTAAGAIAWVRSFAGGGSELATGLTVDANGNATILGSFQYNLQMGGSELTSASRGYNDVFVGHFSASGAHRWSRQFGGTGNDDGGAVIADSVGNIVATGSFSGTAQFGAQVVESAGSLDVFLMRLEP